ncbi:MAG: hypothetical protein Roseis2KO_46490 [Roseivirga sp.]
MERGRTILTFELTGEAVNIIGILMKGIVTAFFLYKEPDEHAAGKAYSQPENIDKRKGFVLAQIAQADLHVVPEHSGAVKFLSLGTGNTLWIGKRYSATVRDPTFTQ